MRSSTNTTVSVAKGLDEPVRSGFGAKSILPSASAFVAVTSRQDHQMNATSRTLCDKYYPADRRDGTRQFYDWMRQSLTPETALLNLGAGPATGRDVRTFKGEVARVVGADIDPVVLDNDELDEAHLIEDGRLPFPEDSFDIVVSDFVLEHVEHPLPFLAEVHRVLKPGGSFFFRTPNKHHYVSLIARMTPHWFHDLVANRVRNLPEDAHEPWPTFHRLNSRSQIRETAESAGFGRMELRMVEAEPSYLMFHALPFLAGVAYERLVNSTEMLSGMRANIFGRLQK